MSEKAPKGPVKRTRPERKERTERLEFAYRSLASESHPTRNEDTVLFNTKLRLVGVLDGLGGEAAGQAASRAAAAAILEEIRQWDSLEEDEVDEITAPSLGSALRAADKRVVSRGDKLKMALPEGDRKYWHSPQTTATIGKLHEFKDGRVALFLAHAGDSRAYVRRADGTVELLTKDDDILTSSDDLDIIEALFSRRLTEAEITHYRELVEEADGEWDMPDAVGKYIFKMRNHVRKSLGTGKLAGVQTSAVTVEKGDIVFITSDGIHDNLKPQRIRDIAALAQTADELADRLAHEAYEYGHLAPPFDPDKPVPRRKRDDITVVAVKVL